MSWNIETVAAIAIAQIIDLTDPTDPVRCDRPYTDRAKLAAYLQFVAQRDDRQVTVVDRCVPHGLPVAYARTDSHTGIAVALCDTCKADQDGADVRRAADKRRRDDASFRRYSGQVARYGS